jgi:hypothetical protein
MVQGIEAFIFLQCVSSLFPGMLDIPLKCQDNLLFRNDPNNHFIAPQPEIDSFQYGKQPSYKLGDELEVSWTTDQSFPIYPALYSIWSCGGGVATFQSILTGSCEQLRFFRV